MYVPPQVIASFDAAELLGAAYGDNPGCGNEGNDKLVGNGSCHAVV